MIRWIMKHFGPPWPTVIDIITVVLLEIIVLIFAAAAIGGHRGH